MAGITTHLSILTLNVDGFNTTKNFEKINKTDKPLANLTKMGGGDPN
jgi:hypothetical protein